MISTITAADTGKRGRNEPCHCGSGRKYKYCCLEKDAAQASAARAEAARQETAERPEAPSRARARTKAGNAPALESDNFSWLDPAHADAAKSRWQLSIEGSVPIVDKSSN